MVVVWDHPFKTSANFHNFWPLPPVGSFLLLIVGIFGQFLTPPPLKDADVLNEWSLCKCNKWRWVFMGVCSFQREGQNLHRLIFACTYHYGNVMYKAWISLQRSRPVHVLLSRFYLNLSWLYPSFIKIKSGWNMTNWQIDFNISGYLLRGDVKLGQWFFPAQFGIYRVWNLPTSRLYNFLFVWFYIIIL